MRSIITKIFVDNWIRKLISLIIAIIVWFVVNESLTVSRNYTSIETNTIEQIK